MQWQHRFISASVWGRVSSNRYSINHSSTFKGVPQSVTEAAGAVAVDAHTFQDGSHATMGGYAVYRGSKYGPSAAKGMTGLAAEFINPVRKMALPLWRPVQNSAAFTVGVAKPEWGAALIVPKKQDHRRNLLETTLGPIGTQEDVFFEPHSNDNTLQPVNPVKPADLKIGLGWYGIKREQISLNEDNLKLLKAALNKLALTAILIRWYRYWSWKLYRIHSCSSYNCGRSGLCLWTSRQCSKAQKHLTARYSML